MARLRDVMAYICHRYCGGQAIAVDNLARLVYLADWKCALEHSSQMTEIQWQSEYTGPSVSDILREAQNDPLFGIKQVSTKHGEDRYVIYLVRQPDYESLNGDDFKVLDHVVRTARAMEYGAFLQMVYSTFPLITQPRYVKLNLVSLADQYKRDKELFINK